MGSATRNALAQTTATLGGTAGIDLSVAVELFQASRAIGASSGLVGALADSAAAPEARTKVVADVFGAVLKPATVALLTAAVQQRWSSAADLVDAVEEIGIRAASIAAPDVDLEGELFQFSRTISQNSELELALGSRLGDAAAKGALVQKLLAGRGSEATTAIAGALVQHPRGRRVRQLLARAIAIVSDQRGRVVATVTSAAPLSPAQLERLTAVLQARYGSEVTVNTIIDPTLVGGLRVQVADDIIDASVAARLADLRQRLAG